MELFDLKNKTAIVTGAGNGLGRGYALNLAKAGATVVCMGRKAETVSKVAAEIQSTGGKASFKVIDICDQQMIAAVLKEVKEEYGTIDILVNNAGTEIAEEVFQVTSQHFDTIMNTNIKGTYMMAQETARYMREQNGGKIINIGSLGSYIGLAESTVYCCSKGAVLQFTKALSVELAQYNIQVNAIAPGYFRTEMTEAFFQDPEHSQWINDRIPLGRIGTTDDLAGTVIFLASKASDYITGQSIVVDGGWLAS